MQLPPAAAPRVQPWGAASQPRARRRAQVAEAAAAEGVGAAELAARVAALCADTTCCTVVALDADERPLRPALLWMDARSAPQACTLAAAPPPSLLLPLPVSLLYTPSLDSQREASRVPLTHRSTQAAAILQMAHHHPRDPDVLKPLAVNRPAPPPRTNRTRRVPHPVLIGHAASLTPY